jgi:histidinol-phosphatase (PHP family)
MRTDVHAHTEFSDGSDLSAMIEAAEAAGLDGLGLTDHCILTEDAFGRHEKYDFDETYERRRERIDRARETTDLTLYDGVELSYAPSDSDRIGDFLATADFDYTIGSVHFAGGYDYTSDRQYADSCDEVRRDAVDRYYDAVVDLVGTELFDVLGHLDLPERQETLRGYSRPSDYDRVAAALSDSRTVPEINAGRINGSLGRPHPDPSMLSRFADRGISFVLGTDSHRPDEIRTRVPALCDCIARSDIACLDIAALLRRQPE